MIKEGHKSLEEILREVAEDENMAFYEINDLWLHQKRYIRKQMDTEGVYAIFLPYIGTLSLNVKQAIVEKKRNRNPEHRAFKEKVEKLKQHENFTLTKNAHKKVTGVNRLARNIIKHYEAGINKMKRLIRHKHCWDIIYRYSNGALEKRDTPL